MSVIKLEGQNKQQVDYLLNYENFELKHYARAITVQLKIKL